MRRTTQTERIGASAWTCEESNSNRMRYLLMRWNVLPLKCKGLPLWPTPFSPVQRARKFSEVLGVSLKRPKTTRPDSPSPIWMSKKTLLSTVWLYVFFVKFKTKLWDESFWLEHKLQVIWLLVQQILSQQTLLVWSDLPGGYCQNCKEKSGNEIHGIFLSTQMDGYFSCWKNYDFSDMSWILHVVGFIPTIYSMKSMEKWDPEKICSESN